MLKLRFLYLILGIAGAACSLQQCQPVEMDPEKPKTADTTTYACAGKTTCGQMRSCAEARYYLKNCPDVEIDGDFDGEPCEEQWCR
jgi:hypothetical protein